MGSDSGERAQGKTTFLNEVDGVTRALKVAMFQMEGAVNQIRDELRATKSQDGKQKGSSETSWNSDLGAEIVVDMGIDSEAEDTPAVELGKATKKVSMQDILDRIPSADRNEAGFTSVVFHELLQRLEGELAELRKKIDSAASWVRHLKEKSSSEQPKDEG